MTETAGAQYNLSPCSRFETPASLKAEGAGLGVNHEECHNTSNPTFIEEGLSLLCVDEHREVAETPEIPFDPMQCLFCEYSSTDLDENLEHMLKKHGLFIPDRSHLIVDFETLIEYLHLVVSGYFECLYCGSRRSSAQAAQQHMIGKGHCKIDILSEHSEFRDFYDFDSKSEGSDGENLDSLPDRSQVTFVDKSMRLPSGKILSHRTKGKPHHHQHRTTSTNATSASSIRQCTTPGMSLAQRESGPNEPAMIGSKRVARREAAFVNQLSSLRAEDRRTLMHFPLSKQRALVLQSKRQVERARRDENEMLLKIQLKANRSSKK